MDPVDGHEGPKTRRKATMDGQQVTQLQVKEIIEAALKPVRESLCKLADKRFIDEAIDKVKEIIDENLQERDEKIKSLEDRVEILESKMAVLDSLERRIALLDNLERKIDDGEQYSRRLCLRINDIDLPQQGESENCMEKVKEVLDELDCGVGIGSVDRAHRIGPKRARNSDGKVRHQMIVRFSSFTDRTKVYRSRKKVKRVRIRLDLTRSRLSTLLEAEDWAESCDGIDFVFADINCNLSAKLKNGKFIFFVSVDDLQRKYDELSSED